MTVYNVQSNLRIVHHVVQELLHVLLNVMRHSVPCSNLPARSTECFELHIFKSNIKAEDVFRCQKKNTQVSLPSFSHNWTMTHDFQQCGILTCVDSDEPVQPPFKLRSSKWCSVSSLTIIEYSSDKQRLWSDCAYAQAGLRLYWSHIPHCWKSHALAQL